MSYPVIRLADDAADLVKAERDRGRSMGAIAARIGYGRSALSSALNGSWRGKSLAPMEAAIRDTLAAEVDCPHLGQPIPATECRTLREQRAPMHSPIALAQWKACRVCSLNPARQTPEEAPR